MSPPANACCRDEELALFWNAFDQAGLQGVALELILLTVERPGEVLQMRSEHIVRSMLVADAREA